MNLDNLVGILAAAGSSRRFGANKLLHPLEDGTPMAVKAGQNLLAAVPNVIAVIRPDALELEKRLTVIGLTTVINPHPDKGLGSSIACAVQASAKADGWVIALADMPFIHPTIIKQVALYLHQGAAICAPVYEGQRGHPVGFSNVFRHELLNLEGNQGASVFLERYANKITYVTTNDATVLRDVDVPNDFYQ